MTDPWREVLSEIDRVAPTDAVYRRALEGPRRAEPPRSPGRRTRVLAGVTAFAVFALAAGFAWHIVRNTQTPRPIASGPTPSSSGAPPLGSPGTVLWPERTAKETADAQAQADAAPDGSSSWRLNPRTFTARFAENVLGWRDGTYQITLDDGVGASVAHLVRSPAPCPSPPPDAPPTPRIDAACLGGTEDVTLVQPATAGDGGIWSVSAVDSPTASIDAIPGQTVTNGDAVTATVDRQDGLFASAGASIGGFAEHGTEVNCASLTDTSPEDGAARIELSIPPDATAGTDCGPETTAYVWVATAVWGAPNGKTGDPLNGDSSPYVAVAAVPLALSIPENAQVAGMSTYTDPRGWKVDYPAGWIVTPFTDSSSGRVTISGAAISNLPMSQSAGGYPGVPGDGSFDGGVAVVIDHVDGGPAPDLLRDDSSFPLDPTAAQAIPGSEILSSTLSFRGDGTDYSATFGAERASDADLQSLQDVIRSIRFPALASGQSNGGWLSMGPARSFKDGEGTPSTAGRLGVVYVMRGPGGTYALDLEPDSCGEGENETWDPQRLQVLLECPDGTEARFERDGTPVPGNPPGFGNPLEIHPVITAWDGSLLIDVDATMGGIVDTYWP
jgi:hypothetical protein